MEQLDRIESKLDQLLLAAVPAPRQKAYDRPAITVDQVTAFDDKTPQSDGSIWSEQVGGSFHDHAGENTGLVRTKGYWGYVSPTKTPEIWEAAKRFGLLDDWDKKWKANPYGLYKAHDPKLLVKEMLDNGSFNFIMFTMFYMNGPALTFVQD